MIRFGWLSITLLIGAVQGIIVAVLLIGRTTNRTANRILSAFLLVFVARIVPYIIGFAGFYDRYPWLSFAPLGITLAYGPLLYLYVARITLAQLPKRWWLHLVPAAIQLLYYVAIFIQPLAFKNAYDARIHEPYVDPAETLLTLASLTVYLFAATRRYQSYERWLLEATSDTKRFDLAWLRAFLILFAITIALDACFEVYSTFVRHLSYFAFFWLYAWFAVLAYYLALEGWRNAGRAYPQPTPIPPHPQRNTVKPAGDLAASAADFLERLKTSELWRDPELTLATLALRMEMTSAQISRLLNDGLNRNFNETINRLRVEYVQERLLDRDEAREILALALEAGFNSKASFNRSFRAVTGSTPSDFRKAASSGGRAGVPASRL